MLDNIRLHVDNDEEIQQSIEKKLTEHIHITFNNNVNKLRRSIPSLLKYTEASQRTNISIFCNKAGKYNIVDYGSGKVVYGFNPEQEIQRQVEQFLKHSPYIVFSENNHAQNNVISPDNIDDSLTNAIPAIARMGQFPSLPDQVDCLVVLGCGLGNHIETLIQQRQIKHLIVYEHEAQFFSASLLVTNWKRILDLATSKKTTIYLQIGNNGKSLIDDIEELRQHFPISGFYLYQHFNNPIYKEIVNKIIKLSWSQIKQVGIHYVQDQERNNFCPLWTPPIDLTQAQAVNKKNELFVRNMQAFATYYPDIHAQFSDYTPQYWLPISDQNNEINILNTESLVPWYANSPVEDSQKLTVDFENNPNKDGLVLGYTGEKLLHYAHYQFVREMDEVLGQHREKLGSLPQNVQSIIFFGLAGGHHLEQLFENYTIDNTFICEPNPDFFYASLFSVDWAKILKKIDQSDARLYLNVGDDGSNLFKDLLSQFYAIGLYILNNTYFYMGYRNDVLNKAVAQLREQLQIVISMGEYFDHAYYGINHTVEAIKRNYPFLKANPKQFLTFENKDVPVFIVGSGPSVDQIIKTIKEHSDKAIIISCGTALKTLYKHGITPDFHAEIEQNRATFEWCSLIEDKSYTQSISLLSCNGIHPDTCDLFKDTYVVFKEGESSTISALEILGEKNVEIVKFAFPTVANLVLNIFSILEFHSIYLHGIDLGFINKDKHHSASTGYYDQEGKEVGNYKDLYNMSIVIEGNFRPSVLTKTEFKLSKQVMEQTIANTSNVVQVFNCSDGARIIGSTPLPIEDILLITTPKSKNKALSNLKQNCFEQFYDTDFQTKYDERFSSKVLAKEIDYLKQEMEKPIETHRDASRMIESQKTFLFNSYSNGRSLLFYYLYGTVNYANAAITKLIDYKELENKASDNIKDAVRIWRNNLNCIAKLITQDLKLFDSTTVHAYGVRESLFLKEQTKNTKVLVVTDSIAFRKSVEFFIEKKYTATTSLSTISTNEIESVKKQYDFIIYDNISITNGLGTSPPKDVKLPIFGKKNTLLISEETKEGVLGTLKNNPNCTILHLEGINQFLEQDGIFLSKFNVANCALRACFDGLEGVIVTLRYHVSKLSNRDKLKPLTELLYSESQLIFKYHQFLVISPNPSLKTKLVTGTGTRGKPLTKALDLPDIIADEVTPAEYANAVSRAFSAVPELLQESLYMKKG